MTKNPSRKRSRDAGDAQRQARARNGTFGPLLAEPGATEQFPVAFAARMSKYPVGSSLYRAAYLVHPSPYAHWDATNQCGSGGGGEKKASAVTAETSSSSSGVDALCFPMVDATVGLTHAPDGTRLVSIHGQPLDSSWIDPNDPTRLVFLGTNRN